MRQGAAEQPRAEGRSLGSGSRAGSPPIEGDFSALFTETRRISAAEISIVAGQEGPYCVESIRQIVYGSSDLRMVFQETLAVGVVRRPLARPPGRVRGRLELERQH